MRCPVLGFGVYQLDDAKAPDIVGDAIRAGGLVAIPKTATPARIVENISVFDFKPTPDAMARIEGLDRADGRIGPDSETSADGRARCGAP